MSLRVTLCDTPVTLGNIYRQRRAKTRRRLHAVRPRPIQISFILVDFDKEEGFEKPALVRFLGRLNIWIGRGLNLHPKRRVEADDPLEKVPL